MVHSGNEKADPAESAATMAPGWDEQTEPEIVREVVPSVAVTDGLLQALLWELLGDREANTCARYVYLDDASRVAEHSTLTAEEFCHPEDPEKVVLGLKLTLASRSSDFSGMPETDAELAGADAYIETLQGELRSLRSSHRAMERQISDYEARLGLGDASGTS